MIIVQNIMRLREQQHNQLFRQQPMIPGQIGQIPMRRNPMVPNLQKTVLQNNTPGLYEHSFFALRHDSILGINVVLIESQFPAAARTVSEESSYDAAYAERTFGYGHERTSSTVTSVC